MAFVALAFSCFGGVETGVLDADVPCLEAVESCPAGVVLASSDDVPPTGLPSPLHPASRNATNTVLATKPLLRRDRNPALNPHQPLMAVPPHLSAVR